MHFSSCGCSIFLFLQSIVNPVIIFRATLELNSELHFESRLLFDKDGYFLCAAGERSMLRSRKRVRLLSSGLGKIF